MRSQPILHIYDDDNLWEDAVILYILDTIAETLINQDQCSICLSGGSTPRKIYERLSKEGTNKGLDWAKVQLFWGDERAVPHDHPDSNYKMVKEALLDHINIPKKNIFPVPSPDKPKLAAQQYESDLQAKFTGNGKTFDLSLLGMGDDGHTASIFPFTNLVKEQKAWAKEVYLKDKDIYRISVSAPVINRSRNIAFLVKGANKAEALKEVLDGDENPDKYPAQLIRRSPNVHWFLDMEAAGKSV